MAAISHESIRSSEAVSQKANDLGEFVYGVAKALNWLLAIGMGIALIAVYQVNDYPGDFTDWGAIWPLWGVVIGAWLFYSFLLMMIMLFAAQVRTQAWSLAIKTQEVMP